MTQSNNSQSEKHGGAVVETAILEAARDLLAEGGVESLSMRHVAERVGVSATAIYHYFEGKQDLVNCVVLRGFARFGSYLTDAMNSQPKGSVERIYALGEAYLRFALENEAYFRVLFSIQPQHDDEALRELPEGGGFQLLREAVSEAIESGTLRRAYEAVDDRIDVEMARRAYPDLLSIYLWSVVHGLVTLTLCGASDHFEWEGRPSVEELLRVFEQFVSYGIRAPASETGESEAM